MCVFKEVKKWLCCIYEKLTIGYGIHSGVVHHEILIDISNAFDIHDMWSYKFHQVNVRVACEKYEVWLWLIVKK